MPTRRDGLRPGEVARAKRVARTLADAINDGHITRVATVRSIVARLKESRMRPRDFDCPNGADAIAAIVATMSRRELQIAPPPLGKIWELIASRSVQYLGRLCIQ